MLRFRDRYLPKITPDWRSHRTVVVESDDWGACEYAPTRALWEAACEQAPAGSLRNAQYGKLESPEELERLGALLDRYPDGNGLPLTLTAFFCLANPDYARIKATGEYHDLPVDRGFPPLWQGAGLVAAWRQAVENGWLSPEFHSRLHHIHAGEWLRLLKGDGPESEEARRRFEHETYYQNRHYPEYAGMTPEATWQWIAPALATFERLFSRRPTAGVTSDATALTEIIWAANGIRTFCLRNFSIPGAAPLVYATKPWNNQDPATPMGAWNPVTDVVYLSRNIFFEPGFDPEYRFEKIISDIEAVWQRNEPAILSTHRLNFISWNREIAARGLSELQRLLAHLHERGDVHFMTTDEVAQLYRTGRSRRLHQGRELVHCPPLLS